MRQKSYGHSFFNAGKGFFNTGKGTDAYPHLGNFMAKAYGLEKQLLLLQKIGCTRQSESTLSLRSLALSLQKINNIAKT